MFDKFGKLNTVEELNAAAAGLLAEGDTESIIALAQENGLDVEDAQDYADGMVPELATVYQAAVGWLGIQRTLYVNKSKYVAEQMACHIIITMLLTMCTDPELVAAVVNKDKNVLEIYNAMGAEAKKHASGQREAVSCGTDEELRKIIRAYYLDPKSLKKKLMALYVLDGEG
ncbi:hypothetical protein [Clostridium sp. AN503]|uniref:hypothetical protein n=1 Tax=Clostridium sp. AN503 TaxID=3160598 RepID=UPI003458CE73